MIGNKVNMETKKVAKPKSKTTVSKRKTKAKSKDKFKMNKAASLAKEFNAYLVKQLKREEHK